MGSKIIAANKSVAAIAKQIDKYYQTHGEWPRELDNSWFRSRNYPRSPFVPDYPGNTVNINDSPNKWHPGYKALGTYPPFWYCRGNGTIRIRVPPQESNAATLALYNAANQTNAKSLSDQSM